MDDKNTSDQRQNPRIAGVSGQSRHRYRRKILADLSFRSPIRIPAPHSAKSRSQDHTFLANTSYGLELQAAPNRMEKLHFFLAEWWIRINYHAAHLLIDHRSRKGGWLGRICQTFLDFEETEESKIFENEAFEFWKVTVERLLRLAVDLSEERWEEFFDGCIDAGNVKLGDAVHAVGNRMDSGPYVDYNRFLELRTIQQEPSNGA